MTPWQASDAKRHNKKVRSEADAEEWASVANGELRDTGDEGLAITRANAHILAKHKGHKKKGK